MILILLIMLFASGWMIAKLLGVKGYMEKAGLGLLLGSLFLTIKMMVLYQLSGFFIDWQILLVESTQLVALIIIFANRFGLNKFSFKKNKIKKFTQTEKIMLVLIFGIVLYGLMSNLVWPISAWDSIALYDFRAQLIKKTGSWAMGKELGYFFHYPPYTSLLHGVFYLFGFEKAKIWYSLLYSSFMALFYSFLRRKIARKEALFGVFLLSISPLISEHVTIAYTNMPYSIFISSSIIYSWLWIESNKKSDFVLAIILSAASSWVRKAEPFWIIPIVILAISSLFFKKNKLSFRKIIFPAAFFIGLQYYWNTYVSSLSLPPTKEVGLNNVLIPLNLANVFRNIIAVGEYLIIYIFKPIFLLLLSFLTVVVFDKQFLKTKTNQIALGTILFIFGMVVAGTYYFSFTFESWNRIGGSATRMIMFIVPLLIYLIAGSLLTKKIFRDLPKSKK